MGIYLFFLPEIEENIISQSKDNLQTISQNTASFIEHHIEDEQNKISVLANNTFLKSSTDSIEDKKKILLTYHAQYQVFDEITLLDTNGTVLASTDYNYRGEWETKTWYQQAFNGTVVSDAHIILNPWKLIMLFLSPVTDEEGTVIMIVSGQIDLSTYWGFLDDITVGDTGFVRLINNDGKIIYHRNQSKIFSKINQNHPLYEVDSFALGSDVYTGECNTRFLCAYAPLLGETVYGGEGAWHLFISQEESEIISAVTSFKTNLLMATSVFSIFLFLLGYYISRSVVKPIRRLNKGMEIVSEGNLDYSVEVKGHDEVTELSQSFNSMVGKLKSVTMKLDERNKLVEKLLKQKDEFINQMGHDLKNPLGPLINLLPQLEKNETDPKKKEILSLLTRNVRYMKNLIVKTIKLARLNSPNTMLHLEPVSLNDTLDEILENNTSLFTEKQIEVINDITENIVVNADKIQLGEVFTNLLNNAVKYSDVGGVITINTEIRDDAIMVSIHDTGIGMTDEQLKKLFTEFYKADSSRRDFESSGLGMPIAKRIVEKHGGQLWAESDGLGKGSTFYFTLPISTSNKENTNNGEKNSDTNIEDRIDYLLAK
ncbi:MAG: sensor histidine kinase [Thermoplasmatota archaeon]